jgi:NAD(P)-dependent dehydrogenase (short-subunit alcohol dehydrogenase family)
LPRSKRWRTPTPADTVWIVNRARVFSGEAESVKFRSAALRTGGSRRWISASTGKGLGRACAQALAEQGADLVLTARDTAALSEVAALVQARGRRVAVLPADLSGAATVARTVVEQAGAAFGRLDVVVNNAGAILRKPVLDVSEQDYDAILGLNLKSAYFVAQAAGRIFTTQRRGKLINMGSIFCQVAIEDRSLYAMSKGGLLQMTRTMALEWAPHNVQVNMVAPTFVETALTRELPPDFKAKVLSRTPMGRLAKAEEVAAAVCYLASPLADMVTGQALLVDGGWTCQ